MFYTLKEAYIPFVMVIIDIHNHFLNHLPRQECKLYTIPAGGMVERMPRVSQVAAVSRLTPHGVADITAENSSQVSLMLMLQTLLPVRGFSNILSSLR